MIVEEFCSVEFIFICTRAVNWQAQADKYSKFNLKWLSVGWEIASLDQRRELGKYLESTQASSQVLDHVLTRSMTMAASSTSNFHQTGKLMPRYRIEYKQPTPVSFLVFFFSHQTRAEHEKAYRRRRHEREIKGSRIVRRACPPESAAIMKSSRLASLVKPWKVYQKSWWS